MGLECMLREGGRGINKYGIGFRSGQGDGVDLKDRGRLGDK